MKIRDLNLDDYVIVYDIAAYDIVKNEYSEGMTVVGRVDEIIFNEDGKNEAIINVTGDLYGITDNNYFDLWSNYIESKTEHIAFDKENTKKAKKLLSNDVHQKKRFEHLKGNLSRLDKLPSKEKLHWNAKGNIETEDGIEISIVETLLKDEDLQSYVTNEISRQRGNKKNSGVTTSQSIETIGPNEEVVSHEDTVNHPSHYNYGDIEVINFIEQVTKHYNPNVAYHIGNAIKYLARSPHKNGKEDIEKARWYIERAFENWDVK